MAVINQGEFNTLNGTVRVLSVTNDVTGLTESIRFNAIGRGVFTATVSGNVYRWKKRSRIREQKDYVLQATEPADLDIRISIRDGQGCEEMYARRFPLEYDLPISPAAIWVSFTGSDTTGDGTQASPYGSIRHALTLVSNTGEIVLANGTYRIDSNNRADWLINDHSSLSYGAIPSGNGWCKSHLDRSDMLLIRAETPYMVRWNITDAPLYYEAPIWLQTAQYVSIDGLIIDHRNLYSENTVELGFNNYITRCIVKRHRTNDYGGWFNPLTGSLVEMCSGVGGVRYGFRSGSSSQPINSVCFRLCVGRQDYSRNRQPQATFAFYGNNGGTLARDAAYLNCIAIDGNYTGQLNTYGYTWGSFYAPKSATNIELKGFISLNNGVFGAGSAIYGPEQSGTNASITDSVVWDIDDNGAGTATGLRYDGNGTQYSASMTIGNVPGNSTLRYSPIDSRLSDTLNGTDKTILYQSDGADARFLFGKLGQRHGDIGYNEETNFRVLPFPYEDQIKQVFSENNTTAPTMSPDNNNTSRGFCSAARLTGYIIKYVDQTATIGDLY